MRPVPRVHPGWLLWLALPLMFACETPRAKVAAAAPAVTGAPLTFELAVDPDLQSEPFSGWVYVMLGSPEGREPRLGRRWTNPPPVFSRKVVDWDPSMPLRLDARNTLAHPTSLKELPGGSYAVQAVLRRNLDSPKPGRGPGDLISKSEVHELSGQDGGKVALRLDRAVEATPFEETDRIRLVTHASDSLTAFHGRPVSLTASVLLPAGWSEEAVRDGRRYPVVYWVTGFGGSHTSIRRLQWMAGGSEAFDRILFVVPDASCYRGHSVFADSANNGPWGQALTEELVPEIDRRFGGAGADHRYVTGVSSGGWSSLWLQVTYPDHFNGCWSIVPDPVDFRDFQRIDLYAKDANMYRDPSGDRRPLMRRGGDVLIHYEDFVAMETAMGPGGQIHSFEAVFSPRGEDGSPLALFDRRTGRVDPEVARTWENYDIRLVLERNWKRLGPKLAGKIFVQAGEFDNFYLEGAVELLRQSLEKLGSDADVSVAPGVSHRPAPGVYEKMMQTIVERMEARE